MSIYNRYCRRFNHLNDTWINDAVSEPEQYLKVPRSKFVRILTTTPLTKNCPWKLFITVFVTTLGRTIRLSLEKFALGMVFQLKSLFSWMSHMRWGTVFLQHGFSKPNTCMYNAKYEIGTEWRCRSMLIVLVLFGKKQTDAVYCIFSP